jgi:TRAP-type C4-dicarboxylate transport system substrate-binding protein
VIELPMLFENSMVSTRVLGELYKDGLLDKDYATVKVIALYTAPPFAIFTTGRKVTSAKDLRGLRIRTPSPTVGAPLARLGAIPLGIPASMVGDAVANGTIDGMAFSMDTALTTKGAGDKYLADQMSVVIDLRFTTPGQMVVMNRAKWDALPSDLRATLEKNASMLASDGPRSREASEAAARQKLKADSRYTYITLTSEQRGEIQSAMAPAFDDWKVSMSRLGLDGEHLLTRTRELAGQFAMSTN